jgi:hypothetical protein
VLARGRALVTALASGSQGAASEAAASLAGLGEGSTPAGDDYLMGVLHALWAADPPARAWAGGLAVVCAGRTTVASARWLAAAAHGSTGAAWGLLLGALSAGDRESLRAAVLRVRQLGHTSGAFSLRGFLDTLAAR